MKNMKIRILALILAVTLCMGMAMTTASAVDKEFDGVIMGGLYENTGATDILNGSNDAFISACMIIDYLLATNADELQKIDFTKSFYIAPYDGNGICVDMWFPTTSGKYSQLFYAPYGKTYNYYNGVYSSDSSLLSSRPYLKKTAGSDVMTALAEILSILSKD